jgi:protein-S-isoprenylcysteine O-methyltransferase Ste14
VIIGAALVLACDRLWPFRLPGQLVPLAWPLFAAGTLVIALAVASFVAVAHASGGVGGAPQRHVTAGPFRYLRNPIYAGAVLLLFAIAFFRQSPSFLLAAAAFVPAIDAYVRRMEEPRLRVRFGEDYAVYTRAVPRWIPRWSGWTTSYVAILAAGSLLACDVSPLANGGETPSAAAVVAAQTTMEPAVESLVCTRYVAPDGRDDAPGTEGQPWATFQHAADSAQPGDMLCFRGGVYLVEVTHLTRSGAPEAPVTFIAHPGETPVLDGQAKATELLILDQHTSHVRISGFTLRNFTIWGMALTGENRYVQLDHLAIEGGEAGIRYTYGESAESPPLEGPVEHITLEDSIIHGSQYSALDCTPGPCNDLVIRRVEIYNTGVIGSSFYGSDGLEIARGYPLLVEECIIHDNSGDGIDLNSRDRQGNASGVIVRRNYVMRNRLNGIKLGPGDASRTTSCGARATAPYGRALIPARWR